MNRSSLLIKAALFAAIAALSPFASRLHAQETPDIGFARLEEAAKRIAIHVAKVMREQKQTAIIVGDFTAPPRLKASGGTGVRQLVINAMKAEMIDVRDDAQFHFNFSIRTS